MSRQLKNYENERSRKNLEIIPEKTSLEWT